MPPRRLIALLVLLAAAASARAASDVVTISGGLQELEALVKKHQFVTVEVGDPLDAAMGRVASCWQQAAGLAAPCACGGPGSCPRPPQLPSAPSGPGIRPMVRPLQEPGAPLGEGSHCAEGSRPRDRARKGAGARGHGAAPNAHAALWLQAVTPYSPRLRLALQVDATAEENEDAKKRFGIGGFPTIKVLGAQGQGGVACGAAASGATHTWPVAPPPTHP